MGSEELLRVYRTELSAKVRDYVTVMGRLPTKEDFNGIDLPSYYKVRQYYGGIKNMFLEMGLVDPDSKFKKKRLLEGLIKFYNERGRWPVSRDAISPSVSVYIDYFGSWGAAINEAKEWKEKNYL
jgi:hypothetical protein